MIDFKSFIALHEAAFDIEKTPKGSHVYTTKVGDHKITTSFWNRSTDKTVPGRYEISVTRQGPDDEHPTDMFKGRTELSGPERIQAAIAIRSHVHHFIKNGSPYELYAGGNTKRKRDMYKGVFDSLGKKFNASVNHTTTLSGMRFAPTTDDQIQRAAEIKQSNLEKIKAALAKRAMAPAPVVA